MTVPSLYSETAEKSHSVQARECWGMVPLNRKRASWFHRHAQNGGGPSRHVEIRDIIQSNTRHLLNSELIVLVLPLLVVESRCPSRDVGKAIPVASLRLIQTAHETVGGRTLERPSCGGVIPTAETTLIPAYSTTSKRLLMSGAQLDNEPNLIDRGEAPAARVHRRKRRRPGCPATEVAPTHLQPK